MPITVNKSQNVNFDTVASNALAKVVATLEKQADKVNSVTVLAHFSVDHDASLQFGAPLITQGLVVAVHPDYKLSSEDSSWFHPGIGRGRTLFGLDTPVTKKQLQTVSLSLSNSMVGEFTVSRPDEFGCEEVSHHIVIDSAPDLSKLYSDWLTQGLTAGEVATQWKRTEFSGAKSVPLYSAKYRANLVSHLSTKAVYSDTVNDVLSDMTHIYFTNNCVKEGTDTVLMKSSALGGYRLYTAANTAKRFYPASLGTANSFYNWSTMTPQNVARISNSCSWNDGLHFNTQVMRPPALRNTNIRKMEDEYNISSKDNLVMRLAHFPSSSAFVDKMMPKDVFQLSSIAESITAPIDPNHPVFAQLLSNIVSIQKDFPTFQLLNPKYVTGNRLNLPTEIYKQVV